MPRHKDLKRVLKKVSKREKRTKQLEIAKNLLVSGVSIDIIEKTTGLKRHEITDKIDNN